MIFRCMVMKIPEIRNSMKKIITLFCCLAFSFFLFAENSLAQKYSISGYIKDAENGEALLGATIYVQEIMGGTTSNLYGYYAITLPPGVYNLTFSFIGYRDIEMEVDLMNHIKMDIELERKREILQPIVVTDQSSNANVTSSEMSVIKLDIKTIERVPALMGEVDIIKTLQLLPGVQASGEGASGFSVRGGSKDQNLILIDEAIVYNASHLMGFFSVFNNDAIKEVKLYKGDIPAMYGGRLSSLLDIRQKDGNMKTFTGKGGIGTIASRFTFEGPIIKDNASFIVAGRRSYADLFLKLSPREELRNNILYFYDLNTKINLIAGENDRLFASAYLGRDIVSLKGDENTPPFKMGWGNKTFTLRWNHLFGPNLFSNFSLIYSNYDYALGIEDDIQGFEWVSDLEDFAVKADFGYYYNSNIILRFGVQSIYHTFLPGFARGKGQETIFKELKVPGSKAIESGAYISSEHKISTLFSIDYGIRFSLFQNIGPGTIYNFDKNFNALDSTRYKEGVLFNTYSGWEPRISFKLMIDEYSSIKGSYNRTMQFIHLASNSTIGTPLDIWLPSSPNIAPQTSDQVAVGYFRNLFENRLETSVELYYKMMENQIDFKDHANLMLNPKIEGEIRVAEATSFGIELLIRKQLGKFTGWIGYTLSKTERRSPWINNGKVYYSPFDRTHDLSVVANYQLNDQWSFGATWVFATGAPVTFPTGRFEYEGMLVPVYSDRNSYRMPDYHRLDIAVTRDGKKSEDKKWNSSWTFSVYNLYNRHNAFSIYFVENENDPNILEAEMIYLFPIIPAITYNFNF